MVGSTAVLGPQAPLAPLCRFTPERAQRGLRLNRFLTAMRNPQCRAAFAADPEASMEAAGLSVHERALVRDRDYVGMLEYGAHNVAIGKASTALGTTLVERGARGRGQDPADFLTERRARNEGYPWHF